MAWNNLKDLSLENHRVSLRRINATDYAAFAKIAFDEEIWRYFVLRISTPEQLTAFIDSAIQDTLNGTRIAFAVIDNAAGQIVGSTAYGNMSEKERKLEIGWSWLSRTAQGSGINRAAKFLLLEHAFGKLSCERVEFKTDILNVRARAGLKALGASEEGVLRSFNYMPDGRRRDVVYYSILASEWPKLRTDRFHDYIG